MKPDRFWLALLLVLALAAGVRFYRLGQDDYWLDELHSFANSAAKRAQFEAFVYEEVFAHRGGATELDQHSTIAAVWRGMRDDSHPPLYFLMLLYWRKLFGDGAFEVRALSAALSVLSIAPVAVLLRRAGQPRAGIIAALLLALAYSGVFVAQQNRQYSLALLLSGCAYLGLCALQTASKATRGKSTARLAAIYAAILYLCMMSHYFCALALAGHAVYAAAYFRGRLLRDWLVAVILAGGLFALTWGPALAGQLDFIRNQHWLSESGPGHWSNTFLRMTDLPARLLLYLEPFRYSWKLSLAGVFLVLLIIVALRRRRRQEPDIGPVALLFGVWFATPVAAFLLLDLGTDKQLLNHLRYPVIALPGLAGLAGLAILAFPWRTQLVTTLAVAGLMFCFQRLPATSNPDSRLAVFELKQRVRPGELIIFEADGDWMQQFFAPMEYYMGHWPNPMLLLGKPPSDTLVEQICAFDRFWVISPRVDENRRPIIPNHCPATHSLQAKSAYIWQIGWIYLFERAAESPRRGAGM